MPIEDLHELALLISLYLGPSLLGLLFAAVGLVMAERMAAVISFTAAAGICVLAHALILYFLSDTGRSWGGPGDRVMVAVGTVVMLIAFGVIVVLTSRKLAKRGETGPPDPARAAAGFLALVVVVYLAAIVVHSIGHPAAPILASPRTWLVGVGGVAAVWGLWRHEKWAWWLALAVCAWGLLTFASQLVSYPTGALPDVLSAWGLIAILEVVVVVLLLKGGTRAALLGKQK